MSGQQPPPHKDDYSPPGRTAANITPQTEEERRDMVRNMMQRAGQALDQVSRQPGMPERADYLSQDAWLRALLTSSLQQSADVTDYFGHGEDVVNPNDTTDNNNEDEDGQLDEDGGDGDNNTDVCEDGSRDSRS
eukprot:scaffold25177_cov169-Amphora_coffeaeformis.AAC.3